MLQGLLKGRAEVCAAGARAPQIQRRVAPLARTACRPAVPCPAVRGPRRCGARGVALQAQAVDAPPLEALEDLQAWLIEERGLPAQKAVPEAFNDGQKATRMGYVAGEDIEEGQVVMQIPGDDAVTITDVLQHELLGSLPEGTSELVALAMWLIAERAKGAESKYAKLIATLPETTMSPILWPEQRRAELLQGSPVLAEAAARRAELSEQWATLRDAWASALPEPLPAATWSEESFVAAFAVVLAHAAYLPSAQCFALLPMASHVRRTGNDNGCTMDYDLESGSVVLTATRPYRKGAEVMINDGRPNGEMALATGVVDASNASDFLTFRATLVQADAMYMAKKQIVEAAGFDVSQEFPLYQTMFPVQLLTYLRLSRIQDSGEMMKIQFDRNTMVSEMNEYEVLQLILADCRERMQAYAQGMEEDIKILQEPYLTPEARLAAELRLSEKKILQGTSDAVRRLLAPIRGIPTKGGKMQDPNADLNEIFDTIEDLPNLPKKFIDDFFGWGKDNPNNQR